MSWKEILAYLALCVVVVGIVGYAISTRQNPAEPCMVIDTAEFAEETYELCAPEGTLVFIDNDDEYKQFQEETRPALSILIKLIHGHRRKFEKAGYVVEGNENNVEIRKKGRPANWASLSITIE